MMTLQEFNDLSDEATHAELSKCCGAQKWVKETATNRPYHSFDSLLKQSKQIWNDCSAADWLEAFAQHPKIGDVNSLAKKYGNTKDWAQNEQKNIGAASQEVIEKLALLNTEYEKKFGFIFIVCATGKTAEEMLEMLISRLDNAYENEIKIAMIEQLKITEIRLKKLIQ